MNPPSLDSQPITTADGLAYVDIETGSGATPQVGQTLAINYTTWLQSDGMKIDSSFDRKRLYYFHFGVGEVIKGFDEGLATMQAGGKRRIIVPPNLAYGSTVHGQVPANSTLIIDVELVGISP